MQKKTPLNRNFTSDKPITSHRLFWLGLALLCIGLFIKLTWEVKEDSGIDTLDRDILVFISNYRAPVFNGPAVDITALGSPTLLTLFTVFGVSILLLGGDRRGSAYLASGGIGAGLGTFLIKHTFSRARPTVVSPLVEVSGFSYPSGHSLGATSIYLLIMFLIWRHFQSWSIRIATFGSVALLIAGVCLSRLYLGVHYPSDVVSGILIGAAWVCFLTPCFLGSDQNLI